LYAQAATLEPKEPERWLDLAQQQVLAGDAEAARQSLAKLKGLELKTWMKVQAASVYHRLGDRESAAALAVEALPSVTESLRDLDADDLEDDDTYWVSRLTESWRYIGEAALAAGDLGRAEKYLEAAWRLEFLPAAGWALGELREKQGRLADAVELWSMASGAAGWYTTTLPADRQKRIVAACAKLPDIPGPVPTRPSGGGGAYVEVVAEPARLSQARGRLTQLRTVRLEGPVVADFTERVLILSAADGRVERVLNVSRKSPREFDRQLAQLSRLRIQAPAPDEHAFKAVRRGLLTCYSASGCALVLDLPKQEAPTPRGSIRFTSVDPHRDATLRRGQRVTLVAKAAYDLPEEGASASIVVRSQPRSMLIVESERKKLEGTAGEVTFTASFTVPEDAEAVFVMALSSQSHLVTDGANYPVR
jgi:tetratricopeptide (TPR) repeat protein